MDFGPTMTSTLRFFRQIGVPITDPLGMVGDLPVGGTITLGEPFIGGSSDDWFRSDYLVLWGFNPSVTRIPDAHYLAEARYRGGRVVAIAPDLSPSAVQSDLWLPVRPGSDAALALAACHVVIEENLYRADYLCEQTDLPFLVRSDTGRFLREEDLRQGGASNLLYLWDSKLGEPVPAPGVFFLSRSSSGSRSFRSFLRSMSPKSKSPKLMNTSSFGLLASASAISIWLTSRLISISWSSSAVVLLVPNSCARVTNVRHIYALERAVACLRRADSLVEEGAPCELIGAELTDATAALGETTGETTSEDVIRHIFDRFCVGK